MTILKNMTLIYIFSLLLYSFILKFSLCSDLYSDKVKKYDSELFKKNVGGNIPHFVNFFAPWCGYCKRLKPIWDELAEKYNVDSSDQKIVIAKVDCTSETPLCADESISGYPSLLFYDVGEIKGIKYQGKRDLMGLEEFISVNIDSTKKEKDTPEIHAKSINLGSGALELTDETFHSTVDWGMHFVKFYAPWCGHCQRMAGTWEDFAVNLQHDKSVTISKIDCTANKKTCAEFEVKGFPSLLWIVNGKKVQKYQGERDIDSFKKFISDMKAAQKEAIENEEGKVPDLKQDTPELVVELSSNNFDNAVAQGLSFIKFYVPWCGHSQRLVPIWNELAQKFVTNSNVKIAKVDCTQDEDLCNKYKVVGYPTLLLFRNGERITEYSGPRKLDNLHSFLLEYLQHHEL